MQKRERKHGREVRTGRTEEPRAAGTTVKGRGETSAVGEGERGGARQMACNESRCHESRKAYRKSGFLNIEKVKLNVIDFTCQLLIVIDYHENNISLWHISFEKICGRQILEKGNFLLMHNVSSSISYYFFALLKFFLNK